MISSGRRTSPSIEIHDERTVCIWDHGLNNPADDHRVRWDRDDSGRVVGSAPPKDPLPPLERIYVAVEIRSRVSVRIREASLWTGQRRAFL